MSKIKTNLPQVRVTDPNLQKLLDSLALVLKTWNGETKNELDRVVTYRDFVEDTDLAAQLNRTLVAGQSGGIEFGTGADGTGGEAPDLTPPAQLTNLITAAGLANVILSWDGAGSGNYAYAEIWRHSSDDLGNATLLGTSVPGVYADSVGVTSQLYYYWVRAVSVADVSGPFNATGGTSASTDPIQEGNFAAGIEPVRVVSSLPTPAGYTGPNQVFLTTDSKLHRYDSSVPEWTTAVDSDDLVVSSVIAGKIAAGAISTSSLFVDGVITGTKIQAGTITADRMTAGTITAASAILANAVITEAKIASLAVTTAKINNLAVTTGKIANLSVDTLQIADNAVTAVLSAFTVGASTITSTGNYYAQTVSITTEGDDVFVLGGFELNVTFGAGGGTFVGKICIFRGSTIIWTGQEYTVFSASPRKIYIPAITLSNAVAAGTYSYGIGVSVSILSFDATPIVTNRFVRASEAKK